MDGQLALPGRKDILKRFFLALASEFSPVVASSIWFVSVDWYI